ncbi:MAG TPA: threonine aldolase [Acholeplasmataceae bacterium]|nr:threonine aldolase [Acholeplasmataceae bacterium]
MYSFRNDYSELVHPEILELIKQTLTEQNLGYGLDRHSDLARKLIQKEIKNNNVDIHFLVGGTSCNKIVIAHSLKPYEAVISVDSGHINVHESGAIEASGHKILLVSGENGKITPEKIELVCSKHSGEHMVVPRMVYISNSTEIGTIYKKRELEAIFNKCQELGLYLFIDGARLGVALTADENDLTLADIAEMSDVFYIGGTKNGAMLGEALVIVNPGLKEGFRNILKQNGGMLAKGYLLGIQFEALFTDNLIFRLARHTNEIAMLLKAGLKNLNIKFAFDSPTNQQFIVLDNRIVQALTENYDFEIWEKNKDTTTIRLVTSWATPQDAINNFLQDLKTLLK